MYVLFVWRYMYLLMSGLFMNILMNICMFTCMYICMVIVDPLAFFNAWYTYIYTFNRFVLYELYVCTMFPPQPSFILVIYTWLYC